MHIWIFFFGNSLLDRKQTHREKDNTNTEDKDMHIWNLGFYHLSISFEDFYTHEKNLNIQIIFFSKQTILTPGCYYTYHFRFIRGIPLV